MSASLYIDGERIGLSYIVVIQGRNRQGGRSTNILTINKIKNLSDISEHLDV